MKGLAPLWLAVMLLLSPGCVARPDWIQATLVTTDVTGVWRGTWGYASFTLVLEQRGPRVAGRFTAGAGRGEGALEGTVEGDVFRFHGDYSLNGEVTVAGDEMSGYGEYGSGAVAGGRRWVVFRRDAPVEPSGR